MRHLWFSFPFKVILEDLPDDFAEALQAYNRQVTDVFSRYLKTVAAEHEKDQGENNKLSRGVSWNIPRGEENKLPLSGIGENATHNAVSVKLTPLRGNG